MTEELGVPPSKIKAYVDVLEQHDVFSKKGLFLLTQEELDSIAKECKMGAPTKAVFVRLWKSGQQHQQSEQPNDVQSTPLSSPEVIPTLPPG